MGEFNMKAKLETDKLIADLNRVVDDSEELLAATLGVASSKADEARKKLTEALATARYTCRELEAKALERVKITDRTIRAHPYHSIGIAFGIGLLIGVLAKRK